MRGHQALALWQELDLIMTHNGANAGPITKFGDGRRSGPEGTHRLDRIGPVLLRTSDRPQTGEDLLMRRRPAVLKVALTFLERLPPFRPPSIEREMEQTLCLVRRYRQEREKADARLRVSSS